MAAPNIVSVASIYGKTSGQALTTTLADFVANAASSGKVFKVSHLTIANIHASSNVDITVTFVDASAGVTYNIAKLVTVPVKGSLVVISKNNPYNLEEGDKIQIQAGAASSAEATCSWDEIS